MRRPTPSDRAHVDDLVSTGLRELSLGRGGRSYLADLAAYLDVQDSILASTLVDEILNKGFVADQAVAVAIDGLALIYVSPEARRASLGTALFEALARDEAVEMWAKPGDRAAKSFAESLGLKARLLVMSAEPETNDGP